MIHNATYEVTHGKRLKILTPKQMLRRLPTALPQLKAVIHLKLTK